MSTEELLRGINQEDKSVPGVIEMAIPQIEKLVEAIVSRLQDGGRLFYIGAGTSGRLGIVDASECPPTYGVPHDLVNGIIAGGDGAIRRAVEFAEDDTHQAWLDLLAAGIEKGDVVVGITASGTTPYVLGGIEQCRINGVITGGISCNPQSLLSNLVDFPIEVVTGPEFVTGSTRMKAGTAQKLVLNMISTATMIRLGRVKGNRMIDMQLSNHKLIDRGVNMLVISLGISDEKARTLLNQYGSVRKVQEMWTGDFL
jgi:N-acetylmuramic acid 6-phosphate etherase